MKIICFSKNVYIHTINCLKSIKNVKSGDIILTFNLALYQLQVFKCDMIASSLHHYANRIHFTNGTITESTLDHPYYVQGKGWCAVDGAMNEEHYGLSVGALEVGDRCICLENGVIGTTEVKEIETITGTFEMYNISGGENHNFFANGILAHDENLAELDLDRYGVEYESV